MKDSLLVSLRNYNPQAGRDPVEDFITEAFAWTLRQNPTLASALISKIDSEAPTEAPHKKATELDWETQHAVNSGRVDMVARIGEKTHYIFEHKVWAEATAAQLDRYRREVVEDNAAQKSVTTVLIAGDLTNYIGPTSPDVHEPSVRLSWSNVVKLIDQVVERTEKPDRVSDFRDLLVHEGLGPQSPLSEPLLRAFARSRNTVYRLYDLVESVGRRANDWSFAYDMMPDTNQQITPEPRWERRGRSSKNGRIAMGLYSDWTPQVLVGLIIDEDDIGVELSAPEAGPHLTVFLGLPYNRLRARYGEIVGHPAFSHLCDRLSKDLAPSTWTVSAPEGKNDDFNYWHPIVLHQPLAYKLRSNGTSWRDQQETVKQILTEGVRAVLSGGELNKLRPIVQDRI